MKSKCTDCNGTGTYTGLTRTETCDTCGGSGEIEAIAVTTNNEPGSLLAAISASLSLLLGEPVSAVAFTRDMFSNSIFIHAKPTGKL